MTIFLKEDLVDILNHLVEHYQSSDLDDDQRKDIEGGYEEIKRIIEES
ncbi:hypothetical protein [Psychrobacillus sp. MER TA 171]|nr:hypothetical protein [Psychrobacillus sp. MER TA 171]MCM3358084.1 hypothetical protein [Psychrobacillus sp. MER TA 171]